MKLNSVSLLTALLLASLPLAAQNFGEITGTVADPSGAVIAGATIAITNEATGVARAAETNESGSYNVPFLNPGGPSSTDSAPPARRAVSFRSATSPK
jgi:hypothetical protein